jgi:hypothetical protein
VIPSRWVSSFVTSSVLDVNAAKQAFGEFLGRANLRADQIHFIDLIITHLTVNGVIDKRMLAEPPFTEVNDQGMFGVFERRGTRPHHRGDRSRERECGGQIALGVGGSGFSKPDHPLAGP